MMDALVLTIDRAYFDLTGGLERWLYRLVRKHGGRQQYGWSFDLHHLYLKSGSLSPFKRFAFELRDIARRQPLPGYQLALAPGAAGQPRLTFQPNAPEPLLARRLLVRLAPSRWTSCESARAIRNRQARAIGNPKPVLSGTEIGYQPAPTLKNRAPNFANRESYGFFLTPRAGRRSVENSDPSRQALINNAHKRRPSHNAPAALPSDHQRRLGNLAGAAPIEVAL